MMLLPQPQPQPTHPSSPVRTTADAVGPRPAASDQWHTPTNRGRVEVTPPQGIPCLHYAELTLAKAS